MRTIILSCVLVFLMISSCDRGEREIVIVPQNYRGYILIIYDQKRGSAKEYDGDKRVYRIPDDGVLRTQFEVNSGWRSPTEYYFEKQSSGNRLQSILEPAKIPQDTVVGLMGGTGSIKINSTGDERVKFTEHFIGTRAEIEQAKVDIEKLDIVKLADGK